MMTSLLVFTVTSIISNLHHEDFIYVPIEDRRVGIYRDKALLVGTLDQHGEFNLAHKYLEHPETGAIFIISGPEFERISVMSKSPEKVYEYRSGILIPGVLGLDGRFVPEVGGTIIKFKYYRSSLTARRIWNLPGTFKIKRVEHHKKE